MSESAGYVCVFNRNRDSYQVPLALAERGLLARFVTDFYAPAGKLARLLPGFLRRRRVEGVPRARVHAAWVSFAIQIAAHAFRMPMNSVFAKTDAMLGNVAGRVARQRGAALYCYHHYLPAVIPDQVPLVVFVFHPLAQADISLLKADSACFPETRASFALEAAALAGAEQHIDWARVDAVVCASSFTARSVIADGCAPTKISVIPYGIPANARTIAAKRGSDCVEFLFVGQGVQRKGLHHLIRAWQLNPPPAARLTIVSYYIDPAIAELISDPSITLLGYQSRANLEALFVGADVFAMPSLVEGFGLVYLEALAHGCHALGTPNTGLPDLHLDANAVTLVEPGDIDAISAALHDCAAKARAGEFDRSAIAAAASRWTQADFRRGSPIMPPQSPGWVRPAGKFGSLKPVAIPCSRR